MIADKIGTMRSKDVFDHTFGGIQRKFDITPGLNCLQINEFDTLQTLSLSLSPPLSLSLSLSLPLPPSLSLSLQCISVDEHDACTRITLK